MIKSLSPPGYLLKDSKNQGLLAEDGLLRTKQINNYSLSANYAQGIMNACFLFPPKTYCFDQLATACLLMWLRVDIIHMGMSFLVLLLGKYSRPLVRRIDSRVRTHTHALPPRIPKSSPLYKMT